MSEVSKATVSQVLKIIPETSPGLSHAEIHHRLGMWSLVTVKHACRQLREEGAVKREGTRSRPTFRRTSQKELAA